MEREDEKEPASEPPEAKPPADRSDQLSPNRALRESVGASTSQRVGDSGPIANPEVSLPDEPESPESREL
jgi:hypothetical protein